MQLNDWFQAQHGAAVARERFRLVAGERPLIIRVGANLQLHHRGIRRTRRVIGERYERMKAASHAPGAVYLLGESLSNTASTEENLAHAVDTMRDYLEEEIRGTTGSEQALLAACIDFLRSAQAAGYRVPRDRLEALARATQGPMRSAILEGTRSYLHALKEAVATWSSEWRDDEWRSLLVVVCAGHAPRYRESTRTYFCRLLDERHGSADAKHEDQVLYAEGADDESQALDLAAAHLVNRRLGKFFMSSPLALQEDVLGDAAKQVLDRDDGGRQCA